MNLFDYSIPEKNEKFDLLLEHESLSIVRIVSSDNFESKKYVQNEDEWILVIEGEATLLLNKKEHVLKKGDSLLIPAKAPHQVTKMTKGTVWLVIHIF